MLVGQIAKRQAITNPENTVFAAKRLIGRKVNSDEVQSYLSRLPYEISSAENGDTRVRLREKDYSPAQLSSFILTKMREVAEAYSEEIDEAGITVPACFNDLQRQATKDAGRIAGLDVLRIINEPTAAALAYGLNRDQMELVAVYDLGGTSDISILSSLMASSRYSTSGDTGGEDFDFCIIDHLLTTL